MDEIVCLVKFGSESNMTRLLRNGELRFSPSKLYNDLHKEQERGDLYEGAEKVVNAYLSKVEVDHPELGKYTFKPSQDHLAKLVQYNGQYLSYSLYAISSRTFEGKDFHQIDKRHLEFGDSAIFIKEPYRFLNAIISELKSQNIDYEMNFVNYVNFNFEGEFQISPFNKKEEHIHQMEFRIIIRNTDNQARLIKIGDISDYCELVSSQSMIETEWSVKRGGSN